MIILVVWGAVSVNGLLLLVMSDMGFIEVFLWKNALFVRK
jgi:hypothetical protein